MPQKIICIDTELSCWADREYQKSQIAEIFEFGMAIIDVDKLEIIKTGNYYVKNTRHPVTEFCTELTGITQKVLTNQGLELAHASQLLFEKWGVGNGENALIAWGNERKFMEGDYLEKGVKYPFHNGLINLAQYYRFSYGNKRKSGLKRVCNFYNIDIALPKHSAEADAITLARLTIAMIKHGHIFGALKDPSRPKKVYPKSPRKPLDHSEAVSRSSSLGV